MTTDLENEAYNLATGSALTTNLSKDEYEALTAEEVYEHVWQPLEMLSPSALCQHIEEIANGIIDIYEDKQDEIINDSALLVDSISMLNDRVYDGITTDMVKAYLADHSEIMPSTVNAMYEAQSNYLGNIADEINKFYSK